MYDCRSRVCVCVRACVYHTLYICCSIIILFIFLELIVIFILAYKKNNIKIGGG